MEKQKQFRKSLERAIGIIRRGTKKGADNLELFLCQEDRKNLSSLIHILNNAEMEYKQGNIAKVESMESMLLDAYSGNDYGINMLMGKAEEISEVLEYYRDASALIEEKLFGKSTSSINSLVPPSYTDLVSPRNYRTFEQLRETRDNIKKNKENIDIAVLKEFKKRCEQKYAQTSGECKWVIDTYTRQ